MRKFLYILTLCFLYTSFVSCEKGEAIHTWEEFSTLQFNGLPNGANIYRNNKKLTANNSIFYKVPQGEALYRFEDNTGKVLLEQSLDFNTTSETITIFDSGDGFLLVKPLDNVEVNPTKFKFDIANLCSISGGKEVNVMVYRLNTNLEIVAGPSTINGVKTTFTEEFAEVDFGDLVAFENGESGLIYILDENLEPYRQDGLPIGFLLTPTMTDTNLHKVYKLVLKEDKDAGFPFEGPFGAYPEGFYVYYATVLLSK
ncbi:hypothetical protein FAZ15_16965 [Sphingobacterium olei]|uniref:Uncharacterized protein n=1 Tax=Sphingobacterium olei TaxID=2571155 RepID=A0A4U0NHN1_9SPHI|nr:hypothetical protein [Sphingobacterium olei]TJZ53715.1 hypothetical protein FAZ15_16965 [Sphingobacterium olei]